MENSLAPWRLKMPYIPNNNTGRTLSQLSGEYLGPESERRRPKELTADAAETAGKMIAAAIAIILLIGPVSGMLFTYGALLCAIDLYQMRFRRITRAPQIRSAITLSLAIGAALTWYGLHYAWPVLFFMADEQLVMRIGEQTVAMPPYFAWLRWALVALLIIWEPILLTLLGRQVTETSKPNLPNSVRAKPGNLSSGLLAWFFTRVHADDRPEEEAEEEGYNQQIIEEAPIRPH